MSAAAAGLQHAACWLALALGLAGCASMEPPYAEPLLPIAATYPGDAPGRAASIEQSAAAVGWRDYFADPHLQALVGQALENNRDLRLALLRVQEAGAAYGIQRAERFPTLGLGASAARSRTPADLNLTGQPLIASQYQVGLSLNS